MFEGEAAGAAHPVARRSVDRAARDPPRRRRALRTPRARSSASKPARTELLPCSPRRIASSPSRSAVGCAASALSLSSPVDRGLAGILFVAGGRAARRHGALLGMSPARRANIVAGTVWLALGYAGCSSVRPRNVLGSGCCRRGVLFAAARLQLAAGLGARRDRTATMNRSNRSNRRDDHRARTGPSPALHSDSPPWAPDCCTSPSRWAPPRHSRWGWSWSAAPSFSGGCSRCSRPGVPLARARSSQRLVPPAAWVVLLLAAGGRRPTSSADAGGDGSRSCGRGGARRPRYGAARRPESRHPILGIALAALLVAALTVPALIATEVAVVSDLAPVHEDPSH